jgi:hypothetical protein
MLCFSSSSEIAANRAAENEASMDSSTGQKRRLNPHGKALRRERIFERIRGGWAYDAIASEEGVTPRRIRQIVSEALKHRLIDDGPDHAMLQLARLDEALRLSAMAVADGDISAISPYLKVLERLDRYRVGAKPKQVYDKAARERLFAKLNRVAARQRLRDIRKAAKASAPAPDGGGAGEPNRAEPASDEAFSLKSHASH